MCLSSARETVMQKKGHSLEGVWNLTGRRHRYMDAACGNEIICPLFCQPGLGPCTGDGTMTGMPEGRLASPNDAGT